MHVLHWWKRITCLAARAALDERLTGRGASDMSEAVPHGSVKRRGGTSSGRAETYDTSRGTSSGPLHYVVRGVPPLSALALRLRQP